MWRLNIAWLSFRKNSLSLIGLSVAAFGCWVGALFALVLAFMGAERAKLWMTLPAIQIIFAIVVLLLTLRGFLALSVKRWDSGFLHFGCACVIAGWLWGEEALRTATLDNPAQGAMVLFDGDVSDKLWVGSDYDIFAGRVPFTLELKKFLVEHYDSSEQEHGSMPSVREYRSRVVVTEPGKTPRVANIRVNHPLYVQGYYIYQMSWGQSRGKYGQPPLCYTVLEFIRDPGLPWVYAGFAIIFLGVLLFVLRIFLANGRKSRSLTHAV